MLARWFFDQTSSPHRRLGNPDRNHGNTWQRNEAPEFENVMQIYLIKTIREDIAKLEVEDVIPTRSNETRNDDFDKSTDKKRNIVERAIGWIKE